MAGGVLDPVNVPESALHCQGQDVAICDYITRISHLDPLLRPMRPNMILQNLQKWITSHVAPQVASEYCDEMDL